MFTYHGHGTWLPDHRRGYVHRERGLQPADDEMARSYRRRQRQPPVIFDSAAQHVVVETCRTAAECIDATLHAVATEPTHVHLLASWRHPRSWMAMRTSFRSALSRSLNEAFGKRDWFADSASRKRVRDHDHFDYLLLQYLPDHRGAGWYRDIDIRAAQERDVKLNRPPRRSRRRH